MIPTEEINRIVIEVQQGKLVKTGEDQERAELRARLVREIAEIEAMGGSVDMVPE